MGSISRRTGEDGVRRDSKGYISGMASIKSGLRKRQNDEDKIGWLVQFMHNWGGSSFDRKKNRYVFKASNNMSVTEYNCVRIYNAIFHDVYVGGGKEFPDIAGLYYDNTSRKVVRVKKATIKVDVKASGTSSQSRREAVQGSCKNAAQKPTGKSPSRTEQSSIAGKAMKSSEKQPLLNQAKARREQQEQDFIFAQRIEQEEKDELERHQKAQAAKAEKQAAKLQFQGAGDAWDLGDDKRKRSNTSFFKVRCGDVAVGETVSVPRPDCPRASMCEARVVAVMLDTMEVQVTHDGSHHIVPKSKAVRNNGYLAKDKPMSKLSSKRPYKRAAPGGEDSDDSDDSGVTASTSTGKRRKVAASGSNGKEAAVPSSFAASAKRSADKYGSSTKDQIAAGIAQSLL